ncbi:MAG: hypothetical protein V2B19_04220 [Pseudomonadota bacterium]
MDRIEFRTEIRENIIRLPDNLKNLNHKYVRVILFEYNREDIPARKLPEGFYTPLHTQSYRVIGKREEIYER